MQFQWARKVKVLQPAIADAVSFTLQAATNGIKDRQEDNLLIKGRDLWHESRS